MSVYTNILAFVAILNMQILAVEGISIIEVKQIMHNNAEALLVVGLISAAALTIGCTCSWRRRKKKDDDNEVEEGTKDEDEPGKEFGKTQDMTQELIPPSPPRTGGGTHYCLAPLVCAINEERSHTVIQSEGTRQAKPARITIVVNYTARAVQQSLLTPLLRASLHGYDYDETEQKHEKQQCAPRGSLATVRLSRSVPSLRRSSLGSEEQVEPGNMSESWQEWFTAWKIDKPWVYLPPIQVGGKSAWSIDELKIRQRINSMPNLPSAAPERNQTDLSADETSRGNEKIENMSESWQEWFTAWKIDKRKIYLPPMQTGTLRACNDDELKIRSINSMPNLPAAGPERNQVNLSADENSKGDERNDNHTSKDSTPSSCPANYFIVQIEEDEDIADSPKEHQTDDGPSRSWWRSWCCGFTRNTNLNPV